MDHAPSADPPPRSEAPDATPRRPDARGAERAAGALLVDRDLRAQVGRALDVRPEAPPLEARQFQAASVDLRLGPEALRVRAGFLPGRAPLPERLAELTTSRLSLEDEGAVLERGLVYLVRLEETLRLPPELRATFNPRSSTGRCDVFTRVVVPGHPRFNEAPPGYAGELWLEVAPLSFPVRLRRGDRLCQLRLEEGDAALSDDELRAVYRATPLSWVGAEPTPIDDVRFDGQGGLELRVGFAGRDPVGWRATRDAGVLDFGREGAHDAREFFEPVHARGASSGRARSGHVILSPGGFYIFASRERVVIPPDLAAEMQPVDVDIGEMRNNYAGFFDNGFGWRPPGAGDPPGTPAVLEVRAHDVPFLVDDGQVFFRLRYFRTTGRPDALYAEGRAGRSYRDQDLTLARCFR